MSNEDQWGPWIEHDGNAVPVRGAVVVWVRAETLPGHFIYGEAPADQFMREVWLHEFWGFFTVTGRIARVVAYRIRKPRGLSMLRVLARDVEREGVDA